jgi:Ty3 transposon capsid-like protein
MFQGVMGNFTTSLTNQAAPRSTRSHLRNPDTFDGSDPAKLRPFLTLCALHFAERTQDFPDDDDKILYVMSYLRGVALEWFAPDIYDQSGTVPVWDGNFERFLQELQDNFGPQDPVGEAEDAIRSCRMKTGNHITSYIIAFDQLAVLTGWGDSAHRHQFYEGLPRRIKDEMVHHNYENTLIGVKQVARRIDARYHKREAERQREREREKSSGSGPGPSGSGSGTGGQQGGNKGPKSKGSSSSPGNRQSSSSSAPAPKGSGNSKSSGASSSAAASGKGSSGKTPKPYADKLDSSGKIKQEERDRRARLNLCMYCGDSGHLAADCKKKSGNAQGRSAAVKTETQAESKK